MAIIAIAKKHALSHKKAKEAAQKVAEDLNKRFDLDYTWNGDCIDFTRPGLTGQLHILKDEVRLDCKLGFLLGTIKSAIEREVHKEFDNRFGKHVEHKEHKDHGEHKEHKGRKA
jgi:putative polyhydroxyalkanoate system protein